MREKLTTLRIDALARRIRSPFHRTGATFAVRHLPVIAVVLSHALGAPLAAQDRSARTDAAQSPVARGLLIGTVVDAIGRPMPDVDIYLARAGQRARTDARGVWRIADPPAGPQVVVARSIGYVPFVREVVVGSAANDSVHLLLRRYPRTLTAVEITARTNAAAANAEVLAERLMQLKVGAGRLYTREQILEQRPYSIAELIQGVPGIVVRRGRSEQERGLVIATSLRAGTGIMNPNADGSGCPLQFYLDNTPIENDGVGQLDPMSFRSVEVYPNTVLLPGLPMRPDRCGAIIINSIRR